MASLEAWARPQALRGIEVMQILEAQAAIG
jgi:hypothetical protein